MNENMTIEIIPEGGHNLDKIIHDLNERLDMLSSKADVIDCLVAAASGVLCGMLDVMWVDSFDLARGRKITSSAAEKFVQKTAGALGCKKDDLRSCVAFLEEKFPIPSDRNTPDFGGGLRHHLRDFAHHPTIVGLVFSLLTQFTEKSYGVDPHGVFKIVDVPQKGRVFIGKDIPDKIFKGTIVWFFHLVSDMAGSSSTAPLSGGTGIPGAILSLAKEMSALPVFKNAKVGDDSLTVFIGRLFNGTMFAKRDARGKIIPDSVIKLDLRGELGVAEEVLRQAIPVVANGCIVRAFYFIRRLAAELKTTKSKSFDDILHLDRNKIKPAHDPSLDRMITIASGVFMTVDVTAAIVTKKYFVAVNYVGVGRFAVALGTEMINCLKRRNVRKIKEMYETIRRSTFTQTDNRIYGRMENDVDIEKFGLTLEQTEILYNLEYLKTENDIIHPKSKQSAELKRRWLDEWWKNMSDGFSEFLGIKGAKLHKYSAEELLKKVSENDPKGTWFRLMLLEAMLFEPYFSLSLKKDKYGTYVPSEKYKKLKTSAKGDKFLGTFFSEEICPKGYIARLRKCFNKSKRKLTEFKKKVVEAAGITLVTALAFAVTAGTFAPKIARALVGSSFAGLTGAALTSACLAYLGGGAIAAGGLGMAGGTAVIVGGGTLLGLGVGAGAGSIAGAVGIHGEKETILQSAKLMTAVKEIFLNDEHDIAYSNSIYEQYVNSIADLEKSLVDLKLSADSATGDEKKKLSAQVKEGERSAKAMNIAMKSMQKFKSAFKTGLDAIQ